MSKLERTAYHEAGHAVAPILWGLPPVMASIRQHGEELGRVSFPRRGCQDSRTPNPGAHIQADAIVSYAGTEAVQRLTDAVARVSEWDEETAAMILDNEEH